MKQQDPTDTLYRGSQKHKNRPTSDRKGTLCPDWTHDTADGGYGYDPFTHSWDRTEAHKLFKESIPSADGRRRFATSNGIAFEAKPTGDGTWHGYPIPWEMVPAEIVTKWVDGEKVTRRQVKKFWRKDQIKLTEAA